MKSMKKLITMSWNGHSLDQNKLAHALLQYRNTPSRKYGLSPAQKLYGRPIQDTLPAHRRAFSSKWLLCTKEVEQRTLDNKQKTEEYYNRNTRFLPEIHIGSIVSIKNPQTKLCDTYGIITEIGAHCCYYIKTQSGCILVRNRHFLRCHV